MPVAGRVAAVDQLARGQVDESNLVFPLAFFALETLDDVGVTGPVAVCLTPPYFSTPPQLFSVRTYDNESLAGDVRSAV